MYAMKNSLSAIIVFLLSSVMPMSAGVREPERVTHYDTLDGLSSTSVGWGLQDGNGLLWLPHGTDSTVMTDMISIVCRYVRATVCR